MTDWQEHNSRYLSIALAWLRARLERCAELGPGFAVAAAPPPGPLQEESGALWKPAHRQAIELVAKPPTVLFRGHGKRSQQPLAQAEAALASAEKRMDPPPALIMLSQRLG